MPTVRNSSEAEPSSLESLERSMPGHLQRTVDADAASVSVSCSPSGDCLAPGERVRVSVTANVPLPLVPDVLALHQAASVPLEASATQTVSRFAAGRDGAGGGP